MKGRRPAPTAEWGVEAGTSRALAGNGPVWFQDPACVRAGLSLLPPAAVIPESRPLPASSPPHWGLREGPEGLGYQIICLALG